MMYNKLINAAMSDFVSDTKNVAIELCDKIDRMKRGKDAHFNLYKVVANYSDEAVLRGDLFKDSACKAGCSFCCTIQVDTTKCEAKAVAFKLKQMPQKKQRDIMNRMKVNAAIEKDGFDAYCSKNPTCAFVDPASGYCDVYDVRPIACRCFDGDCADECMSQFGKQDGRIKRTPELVYLGQLLMNVIAMLHMQFGLTGNTLPLHTGVLREINAMKRK